MCVAPFCKLILRSFHEADHKNGFFVILYGEHAFFNITGLAYLGGSGFCKRRGHARKRPSSSARTGICKKRGGESH